MMTEDVAADTMRRLRQIEGEQEDPDRLTADVVAWLRELDTYTAEHRYLTCECPARGVDHESRRAELLARKRAILARIEQANP